MHQFDTLSSGVANIVRVATDAQVLVNAPLDAVARAAQTNIDAAMNVACGIRAAVDWRITCQLCNLENGALRLRELLTSTATSSTRLLPETTLDTAEWVASADLIGVDAADAPVEFAQAAAVDFLAFEDVSKILSLRV
jgi:hypothetical protein